MAKKVKINNQNDIEIKFKIDDLLDDEKTKKLKSIFQSFTENTAINDENNFIDNLIKVAKSAFTEYIEMILGLNLPSKVSEIRERRLLLLIKYFFIDVFPTENNILSLFQLTENSSRTLLRNVRAKYKFDIENLVFKSIQDVLENRTKTKSDNYRFIIRSENILEEIKSVVSSKAPELEQIQKVKNSAGVYEISPDTYKILCENFNLDFEKLKNIG